MPTELPVGTEIAGHRIEALIGRGGMGAVYLAEHLRLRRRVALKVLISELAQDETFRARFIRESQIAASLDHPNVVTVYDAGESDGLLYISMRYVDGPNLGRTIRDEGPLDPKFVVSVIDQVGGALDAAHALGLVHRDVKPANVLLSRPGEARSVRAFLTDFGITKRIGAATQFTQTGQLVGTYTYMAPEQIRGDPLDGRTDIYSLGCIVYECLTAKPPFGGDSPMELMFSHMNQQPPTVRIRRPELPEAVDRVVARGMAKNRDDRYPTSAELAADLREALGLSTAATLTSAPSAPAPTIAPPTSPTVASPPSAAPTVTTPIPPAPSFPSAPPSWDTPAPSAPAAAPPTPAAPLAWPPSPAPTRAEPGPPPGGGLAGTIAEPQVRQPPPGRRGPRLGLVLGVVALLVAVIAGAVVFLGKGKSGTTTTSGSPTTAPSSHPSTHTSGPSTSPSSHGSPSTAPPVARSWQRIDSSAFGGSSNQTMNRVLATPDGVLAVGYDGPADDLDAAVWTSVNGRTWSEGSVPSEPGNQGIAAVAPGGPGYVAVGASDSATGTDAAVWTSRDGSTWTRDHSQVFGGPGDQAMRRVVVAPPGLVAVGSDGSGGDLDAAVWLFDGHAWSIQHDASFGGPSDQEMRSAVRFGNGLIAVGFDSGGDGMDAAVWRSPDGTSWSRVRSDAFGGPGNQIMITVERGGPGLVAVGSTTETGNEDAAVWTSSNGTTWQRVNDPSVFGGPGDQELIGVVSTASGLVAGGFDLDTTDGVIWTSTDGRTWVRKDIPQLGGSGTQQIKGIAEFGRDLVAVGRIRSEGSGGRDEDAGVWVGSPESSG